MKDNMSKMSRSQIVKWIKKFERAISIETDEYNLKLFKKWKEEAENELLERDFRKQQYLKCKEKGLFY